jgi:hypothetical protein
MPGGSDKAKQKRLEQQQAQDRQMFVQAFQQAQQPRPLETRLEADSMGFLDDVEGKNGVFDITRTRGMSPYLDLYNRASAEQQGERMGIGALRLGAEGSNPNLTSLLTQQAADRRRQEAGGALERAFALRNAEARGSVLPLIGLQQSRTMGLAGMAGNQSAGSTSAWANFRPAPSFWQQALLAGIGAGGQAAGAYYANR